MYTLFFNKSQKTIKINKANKNMQNQKYTDEVTQFNDCYYLCTTRKPLVLKANELWSEWLKEAEQAVDDIRRMKF